MKTDLNKLAGVNCADQRSSAFISGQMFCFSPRLRASVVRMS